MTLSTKAAARQGMVRNEGASGLSGVSRARDGEVIAKLRSSDRIGASHRLAVPYDFNQTGVRMALGVATTTGQLAGALDGLFVVAANACPVGLALVDGALNLYFGNLALRELLGDEPSQRADGLIRLGFDEQRQALETAYEGQVAVRMMVKDAHGASLAIEVLPHAVPGRADFKLLAFHPVVQSDSAARREAALERKAFEAQSVAQRTRLHAGIAHDFNNLLATLLGHAAILRIKTEDSELLQSIAEIELATQHASALIQQLRPAAPTESEEEVNLAQVLDQSIRLASASFPQARFLPLVLPASGVLLVKARTVDLFQIFFNLLSNAGEAVEGQRGQVHVRLRHSLVEHGPLATLGMVPQGSVAQVEICDNGPGIAASALPRIFDAFFTTKTANRALGSGLGLATVRDLVLKLGGAVSVSSQGKTGACFSVFLSARMQ